MVVRVELALALLGAAIVSTANSAGRNDDHHLHEHGFDVSSLGAWHAHNSCVALGGEVFRHFAQKKTHVFARARYADKKCTATTTYSTMGVLSANYFRKVDHRCGLAAEIELNTANLDSHLTLGYEFVLRQAKLCGQLASTGTVQATLEEMITPGFSVSFSAMLNHKANQQKFGMGVRIG